MQEKEELDNENMENDLVGKEETADGQENEGNRISEKEGIVEEEKKEKK